MTETQIREMREDIRQMLRDWNAATDEQRTEALRQAAEAADKATR